MSSKFSRSRLAMTLVFAHSAGTIDLCGSSARQRRSRSLFRKRRSERHGRSPSELATAEVRPARTERAIGSATARRYGPLSGIEDFPKVRVWREQ